MVAVSAEMVMRSGSPAARGRFIQVAEQASQELDTVDEPRLLAETVAWLELYFAGALTAEFIRERGVTSWEDLRGHTEALEEYVLAAFPEVAAAALGFAALVQDLPARRVNGPLHPWEQIVRQSAAVVAELPMDLIEASARRLDEPALGHRARTAYDALQAFVRRHDVKTAEVMGIVGEQYRRGNVDLLDAARLLRMSTSDAVFELEAHGFVRPPAVIALGEPAREAIYQRLRADRLARNGRPVVDPELVERDAIASERIEGIDARAWIRGR